MKKILILMAVTLVFLVSNESVLAAEEERINVMEGVISTSGQSVFTNGSTGDFTSFNGGTSQFYILPTAYSIDEIHWFARGYVFRYVVSLYADVEATKLIEVHSAVGNLFNSDYYSKKVNTENVRAVRLESGGSGGNFSEIMLFGKKEEMETPGVLNLKVNRIGHDFAELKWDNPVTDDIQSIVIKKNGTEFTTLSKEKELYLLKGLDPEIEYEMEVIVKYSESLQSIPVNVNFKTLKAPTNAGDISGLTAKPEYNRVDLSWVLPTSNNLKHVSIYRDTLEKSFLDKLLGVRTVKAATPIFETNGTYFNDLTVQPETKYEYFLSTTSTEGLESGGVSTIVTTLKKPEPEIEGGGYEKDPETGDFTYTWTKPTTGKVKVMINGKLHATVEASNGKIIIPAADMKFTIFGKPDVELIPVDEEGDEGKPVKPPSGGENGGENGGGVGDSEMPFSGSDLIKATFDFIKILGPIIILILIIRLTPRLINVIRNTIKNKGVDSNAR